MRGKQRISVRKIKIGALLTYEYFCVEGGGKVSGAVCEMQVNMLKGMIMRYGRGFDLTDGVDKCDVVYFQAMRKSN